MYKKANLLSLYCENPVHAGSGSDLGIVDLPVQREKHTDYPIIQASTLKGAIRDSFESDMAIVNSMKNGVFKSFDLKGEDNLRKVVNTIFGEREPGKDDEAKFASAISFTDARLLLFPVKSAKNTFVWVTSTHVLNRLKRDAELAEIDLDFAIPFLKDGALIGEGSDLNEFDKDKIILEEYTFLATPDKVVDKIGEWIAENIFPQEDSYSFWQEKVKRDLVVLNEDDFRDFVRMSTEVIARTKIDNETRVVDKGALWYEENLPSDTVLYSLVMASNVLAPDLPLKDLKKASQVLQFFAKGLNERIQLGGNETVGRGIIKTNILTGGN